MQACFDCGRKTHHVQRLFDNLPSYCPGCLFELRARIVKDLNEKGYLQLFLDVELPSRPSCPIEANLEPV